MYQEIWIYYSNFPDTLLIYIKPLQSVCAEGLVHGKQAAVGGIEAYHVRYQELRCLQFQRAVLVVVKDFFKFRAVVTGSGQGDFKPHISLRSTGTTNNNQ